MRFSPAPSLGGPSGPETSEGPGEAGGSAQSVPSVPGAICLHLTKVPTGRASGGPSPPGSELPGSAGHTGRAAESSQLGSRGRQAATRGRPICSSLRLRRPRALNVAPARKDAEGRERRREGTESVCSQQPSDIFPRRVGWGLP